MSTLIEYYNAERRLINSLLENSSDSLDLLLEALSVKLDLDSFKVQPLNESVIISDNFDGYIPLIESVDMVNEIKAEIDAISSEPDKDKQANLIKKIGNKINSLMKWWYKIEPNKKFKVLHVIIKVMSWLVGIAVSLVLTKKVEGVIGVKNTFIKWILISACLNGILQPIGGFINVISKKMDIKINKPDIDRNIREYDKVLDKIIDILSKNDLDEETRKDLNKLKKNLENCIYKLHEFKAINLDDSGSKNE